MTTINGKKLLDERYLGDGVRVGFDGHGVWLYVSQGLSGIHKFELTPCVATEFVKWHRDFKRRHNSPDESRG